MDAGTLSLRIVSLEQVVLHEGIDPRRVEDLKVRLQQDGVLRNPPVVAVAGEQYVVLDGATRAEALRSLGCPTILVQIVDPADKRLQVGTWHHLITGLDQDFLSREMAKVPGASIEATVEEVARSLLEKREIVAYLLLGNRQVLAVRGRQDLKSQASLLNRMVNLYRGRTEIFRVVTTELEHILQEHEQVTALVVFPQYRIEEILELATSEVKLPTGITRFVIPGRVLRIDLDLEVLRSSRPLEEKNNWLGEYVRESLKKKKIRYYQEPVFLFED